LIKYLISFAVIVMLFCIAILRQNWKTLS